MIMLTCLAYERTPNRAQLLQKEGVRNGCPEKRYESLLTDELVFARKIRLGSKGGVGWQEEHYR